MQPLVSVIIPTYNRGDLLAAALASVQAQTFRDYEVLVVDDGSEDDLRPVIAAFPGSVRHIRVPHGGAARARNAGIEAAATDLLAFLDSDDTWLPEHLARTVPILQVRSEIGLVYHDAITVDDAGHVELPRKHRRRPSGQVTAELFAYDFIPTPSVVCRRQLLCQAGGFDPAMVPSEDYDLWLKMSLLCRFACVDEPLMQRRKHAGNISRQHKARNEVLRAVLKERFWRDPASRHGLSRNQAEPVLAKAFYRAGRLLLRSGYRTSARQCLRRALTYRGFYPRALFMLALAGWRSNGLLAAPDPAAEVLQTTGYPLQ